MLHDIKEAGGMLEVKGRLSGSALPTSECIGKNLKVKFRQIRPNHISLGKLSRWRTLDEHST